MKKEYIVWFSMLFVSCNVTELTLGEGTITYLRKMEDGIEKIIIKNDSSFIYKYQIGLIDQSCEGNWSLKKGELILKTYDKYKMGVLECREEESTDSIIQICVVDQDDIPLIGALITLNGDEALTVKLNYLGIGKIYKQEPINNILVSYLGNKYECKVKKEKSNNVQIRIKLKDLSFCEKYNEIWKIKSRNRLIHPKNGVFKLEH